MQVRGLSREASPLFWALRLSRCMEERKEGMQYCLHGERNRGTKSRKGGDGSIKRGRKDAITAWGEEAGKSGSVTILWPTAIFKGVSLGSSLGLHAARYPGCSSLSPYSTSRLALYSRPPLRPSLYWNSHWFLRYCPRGSSGLVGGVLTLFYSETFVSW